MSINMFFMGIDIGSTMTKVMIRDDHDCVGTMIKRTSAEHRRLAHEVFQDALKAIHLSVDDIRFIVATGYGRINVPFADKQISEISCHARGTYFLFPSAKTIIDIGGQDCKCIKIDNGLVQDFVMNDSCAAGTGRFLEVVAEVLGVELSVMGDLALKAQNIAEMTNTCTVFIESEALLKLAEGFSIESILSGIHQSLAMKVFTLASRLKIEKDVVITGGGAKNSGLIKFLRDKIGLPSFIPSNPLLTGALGAALYAQQFAYETNVSLTSDIVRHRKLEAIKLFNDNKDR